MYNYVLIKLPPIYHLNFPFQYLPSFVSIHPIHFFFNPQRAPNRAAHERGGGSKVSTPSEPRERPRKSKQALPMPSTPFMEYRVCTVIVLESWKLMSSNFRLLGLSPRGMFLGTKLKWHKRSNFAYWQNLIITKEHSFHWPFSNQPKMSMKVRSRTFSILFTAVLHLVPNCLITLAWRIRKCLWNMIAVHRGTDLHQYRPT